MHCKLPDEHLQSKHALRPGSSIQSQWFVMNTCVTAQATKTYTAHDYADIMEHLIKHWNIASLTGALLLLPGIYIFT